MGRAAAVAVLKITEQTENGMRHETTCPRCGGAGTPLEIDDLRKAELPSGKIAFSPASELGAVGKKFQSQGLVENEQDLLWLAVNDNDIVPSQEPCDKCKDQLVVWDELVKAGGVAFRCKTCTIEGVITEDHAFAKMVREQSKQPKPAPLGVAFDNCEQHARVMEGVNEPQES
jgi:hypothetical protein